jgi:HK97 gp10 family phage protein
VSRIVSLPQWTVELAVASVEVNREASEVVRSAALLCQETAIELVPTDTSNLKNSISVGRPGQGKDSLQPGDLTAEVGPTAEYGAYVEFGTSRMGAQPYMTPASEKAGEWFVQTMARQVGIR